MRVLTGTLIIYYAGGINTLESVDFPPLYNYLHCNCVMSFVQNRGMFSKFRPGQKRW